MSKTSKILTSSLSDNWRTPSELFNKLNNIFNFDMDCCASEQNHLCEIWSDDIINDFSLMTAFEEEAEDLPSSMFCNSPYSKKANQAKIVKFLLHNSNLYGIGLICLIPARVETKLWQEVIFKQADFVYYLKGRVHFLREDGSKASAATFPSALVINGFHSSTKIAQLKATIPGVLHSLQTERVSDDC